MLEDQGCTGGADDLIQYGHEFVGEVVCVRRSHVPKDVHLPGLCHHPTQHVDAIAHHEITCL
eukprot:6462105-Prorocentrum_lima.AAC.1